MGQRLQLGGEISLALAPMARSAGVDTATCVRPIVPRGGDGCESSLTSLSRLASGGPWARGNGSEHFSWNGPVGGIVAVLSASDDLRRNRAGRTLQSMSTTRVIADRKELADAELLSLAERDDEQAFAQIYDRHVAAVYRYALSIVNVAVDAEDVTQEVFILAWTKAAEIRIVDRSLLPWLLTAARFTSLNRVRSRSRRREDADTALETRADHRFSPEVEVQRRVLMESIEDAVLELSETDQVLFSLCIDEGLSYEDAARALGTTHSTVRNRLSRLRRTLRARLSD